MKTKLAIILGIIIVSTIALAVLFLKSVEQEKENKNLVTTQVDLVSDSDWIKGKREARVSLIEYSDLQCPACKVYYPLVKRIVEEFDDSITFAYRHFPLRSIHFNSQLASQALEAAGKQGKFWQMHDLLFDLQEEWAKVQDPRSLFEKYAQNLGLDLAQFKKDLESNQVRDEVEKDYQSAVKAGVNATPTFFINGQKIQNPKNLEEFKSIIQKGIEKSNE
ncbi:DsbA family protein [Candidatus Daviesbacteria bacterium]|nr:DsbA family protein [Candidatus Daviesbacteria bacterium]